MLTMQYSEFLMGKGEKAILLIDANDLRETRSVIKKVQRHMQKL